MESGTSTLNPYAAPYIPLTKREVKNEDDNSKTLPRETVVSDDHLAVDVLKLKGPQVDSSDGVRSENPHEMNSKFMDEVSEMDLAYLQMMFPGVSDQSIADVYDVNGGDLDAAVDMLTQLESTDDLPDTLGIENAQNPAPSGECSSVKAVNVTGESSCSSGSSALPVAA